MFNIPKIILAWIDIETLGLNPERDAVLEMAWQLTDYDGKPLTDLDTTLTADADDSEALGMVYTDYLAAHPIVQEMHRKNGLINEVLFGSTMARIPLEAAIDKLVLEAKTVQRLYPGHEVRIAGSSVHFDKRFLEVELAGNLPQPFSHRIHDLNVFRPLIQTSSKLEYLETDTDDTHRAADDVERDIRQWAHTFNQLRELLS